MDADAPLIIPTASPFRWTLGFLLVGLAWGFSTPFIRRAAISHHPAPHPSLDEPSLSWLAKRTLSIWYQVTDLLRNPRYAVPLLVNLTGSVWFFLLIGRAGESDAGDGRMNRVGG